MVSNNLTDQNAISGIEAEVQKEVEAAVKFAIDAPYPGVDEVDQDIYA